MKKQLIALIVPFIIMGFIACTGDAEEISDSTISDERVSDQVLASGHYVERDSANKMIGSYLASLPPQDSSKPDLHALILDAEVIRDYLNDTSIKSLKLMFAHTLDYINAGNQGVPAGYQSGAFTMVMLGFNAEGNYIYLPGKQAFNRWVPCPLNCPDEGDAASDYLN